MMRTAFIAVLMVFRFHDALGVAFTERKAARVWRERLLPSQPFTLPSSLETRGLEFDSSTELRFGRDHHREGKGFGGLGYLPLKLEGLAERAADTLRSVTHWAAAKDSNLPSKPQLASLPEGTLCLKEGTSIPKRRNRLQLGHCNQRGKRIVSSSATDRSSAVSGSSGGALRSALRAAKATRGGATQLSGSWTNAIEGLKNGLASGLAAACVKAVLQPFDTMKTVQQYSTTRLTLLQAGKELVARGGVKELYQGLGVTLVGSMPAVGIYFGLYQFVKKQMDAKENVSPYLSIIVSAGVGNFIASFFRVPYEVVKQRLQVGAYPNTAFALRSIYSQEGLWGFFGKGGITTQWARDIPYAIVTLLVYETLQKAAARRRTSGGASALQNMVIGAVAGGTGSLVTNPMDMIKTRMMTSPESYAGPIDAAWTALRKEGPQAFMKGATPRLLHKIPANALFFVVYEFFRTLLGVSR